MKKETPVPEMKKVPHMRQIVIETDGNNINLKLAEVSGVIELVAVLEAMIVFIKTPKK